VANEFTLEANEFTLVANEFNSHSWLMNSHSWLMNSHSPLVFRPAAGDPNLENENLVCGARPPPPNRCGEAAPGGWCYRIQVRKQHVWLKLDKKCHSSPVLGKLRTQIRTRIRICCQNKHRGILQFCHVGATWTNQVMASVIFATWHADMALNMTSTNRRLTRGIRV
jgi:hypothetical protein